jgi:release factor glutamine methyltransferase
MSGGAGVTVGEQLRDATAALAAAGVEPARVDAEWLLAGLLEVPRLTLHLALDRPLPGPVRTRYAEAVRRRASREPLQRVLGWEGFRGLRVRLSAAVLVPRPETEALVAWALALLPPGPCRVLDVGTGSGCIACAIAVERPEARVVATDVSPAAAALARRNAVDHAVETRVRVVVADLFDGLRGGWDLVVANPPYLPSALVPRLAPEVARHEPARAVDGGPDGLAVIRRLVAGAPAGLRPGGTLVLETAGGGQAADVGALMRQAGLVEVRVRPDLAGVDRFIAGRMPA